MYPTPKPTSHNKGIGKDLICLWNHAYSDIFREMVFFIFGICMSHASASKFSSWRWVGPNFDTSPPPKYQGELWNILMLSRVNWILEATLGKLSWLNPNTNGEGGVEIHMSKKYARLITGHGTIY